MTILVILLLYCPQLDSAYLNQLIILLTVFYFIKYLGLESTQWALKFFSLIRFSCYLQLLFLNLRITQMIQCTFTECFWIYWIIFCISIGILLGYKIILVAKLVQFYRRQIEKYRMIGTVWMWYILMGLTFNPFVTVVQIIQHFENRNRPSNSNDSINHVIVYLVVYSLVLLATNIYFNEQINIYCLNLEKDELQQEEQQVQQKEKQEQKIEKIEGSKLFSPFLARFSNTYYKTVNASFVMSKQEDEQNKQADRTFNDNNELKNNPIFTIQDENVSFNAQSQSCQPDQCLICYDNKPDAVNMNCGHGGICYECGKDVLQKTAECYLCREKIQLLYKIEGKHGKVVQVTEAVRIK